MNYSFNLYLLYYKMQYSVIDVIMIDSLTLKWYFKVRIQMAEKNQLLS